MVFLMQKSGVVYSFEHNVRRIFAKEFFLNFLVLVFFIFFAFEGDRKSVV